MHTMRQSAERTGSRIGFDAADYWCGASYNWRTVLVTSRAVRRKSTRARCR
jgi:hypothetical protein